MNTNKFQYKICIPYQSHAMGGMYTFLSYFKQYLSNNNIPFTDKIFSKYDVLFINSFMTPLFRVRLAKLLHQKIIVVHRIDGSASDYGRGAEWDNIQKEINKITDLTIFQSNYGKYATREKFKIIGSDGPVIYNAVDTDLFTPSQKKIALGKPTIAYVSFSTNIRKGAEKIICVAQQNTDINFVLIGRFDERSDIKNVEYTGHLDREQVAEKLSNCQMFIFFSENETCPNVIIEALSCGLPVLYLDSGGTSEIVANCGIAITTETFRKGFEIIQADWHNWSQRARSRAEDIYSTSKVFPKYLEAILKVKSLL